MGVSCRKVEVEEVDLCPVGDPKDPDAWEKEISNTGIRGDYVLFDSSLLEGGNVGEGAYVVKYVGAEEEVECAIGDVATVWDGA